MFLKVSEISVIESDVILKGGEYMSHDPELHTDFVVPVLPCLRGHGH